MQDSNVDRHEDISSDEVEDEDEEEKGIVIIELM